MQLNSLTRNSSLFALLLAILVVAVAFVRYHLAPYELEVADSPYGDGVWLRVIAAALFVVTALMAGRLASMSGAFKRICRLPIPLYAVLACGVALSPDVLVASVASLLTMFGMLFMLQNLLVAGEKNTPFMGSLLFGLAAVVYPPCIVLGVVSIASILLFTLSFRQAVISLVGWLLPLFAASYLLWYGGSDFTTFAENFVDALMAPRVMLDAVPYGAIALVTVVTVVTIVGALAPTPQSSSLVRTRRAISFFVVTLVALVAAILLPGCGTAILSVIAVPASVLVSIFLCRLSETLSTLLYWLILAATALHIFMA